MMDSISLPEPWLELIKVNDNRDPEGSVNVSKSESVNGLGKR